LIIAVCVLLVSVVGVVVTKGRARSHSDESSAQLGELNSTNLSGAEAIPAPAEPRVDTAQLEADFKDLQRTIDGDIGLVVRPIGDADGSVVLGSWSSGPAWSTMKVPLAIAALREESVPTVTDEMVAAIERSDNDAANALWQSLGDPPTAARKIEAVLEASGDKTVVQDKKVRLDKPELSAFGQTLWPLTDQARFIASAACDNRNNPIFALMAEVAGDQNWGLGHLDGSRYKGGWGPSVAGNYLVRQIGVLQTSSGQAAVAVAVQPASGSFEAGTEALNKVAAWLAQHEPELPSGKCPEGGASGEG
jgi:hypothetical protein